MLSTGRCRIRIAPAEAALSICPRSSSKRRGGEPGAGHTEKMLSTGPWAQNMEVPMTASMHATAARPSVTHTEALSAHSPRRERAWPAMTRHGLCGWQAGLATPSTSMRMVCATGADLDCAALAPGAGLSPKPYHRRQPYLMSRWLHVAPEQAMVATLAKVCTDI